MNPPIGLASYVLGAVIVLECALAALQVLEKQFVWAAIAVPLTAAILGVLRVWQVPHYAAPKDGDA